VARNKPNKRRAVNDGGTAGAVLGARIGAQVRRIAELDGPVRADAPDAVHQMRVAARRLRSALRSYRRLLREDTTPIADELRWLGGALGRARDSEVLGERLLAQAAELPVDGGRDGVVADLTEWAAQQRMTARPEVLAALDSERYRELAATLDRLAADPPYAERADRPAGPELTRTLRREQRRVAARIEEIGQAAAGEPADRALHEARKAAKRARYAGETAGAGAEAFTAGMKELQELLGRHQDAVIARDTLRILSDGGFGYGVLYGRQLGEAAHVREVLPELWRRVGRRPARLG